MEDDHAAELSHHRAHPLSGATGSWGYVRSVSKPYGPDLRLGVLAGDETSIARVAGRMRLGAGWVSTILQRLVLALCGIEQVAAGIRRAGEIYAERRDRVPDRARGAGEPRRERDQRVDSGRRRDPGGRGAA